MHNNYEITKGFGTDGQAGLEAEKKGRRARPLKVRVMLVREGRPEVKPEITGPGSAFLFLRPKARGLDREHFWRIDVSARNQVIGWEVVSIGTLSASLVHPREVFLGAILEGGTAGIIIAHNHPSGDVTPSQEDKDVTRRLAKAGELLGVPLLDHLIVGDEQYFSFKDSGLL